MNRESEASRKNAIGEIVNRGAHLNEYPQLLVFPEGTTTNGTLIAPRKYLISPD